VSSLLQDHFLALYTRTAATYTLAANYRSRPAIVHVADIVRGFA
jgi:ATP-dependent exoDNAse (exonuclease V) beta subunit